MKYTGQQGTGEHENDFSAHGKRRLGPVQVLLLKARTEQPMESEEAVKRPPHPDTHRNLNNEEC